MTEAKFNEWLETQPIEDKLVYLKYKYSHEEEWTFSNEILEVEMSVGGCYVWLNDWDEGQQDVEILGCIAISDIDVPIFDRKTEPQIIACPIQEEDADYARWLYEGEPQTEVETMSCEECKHYRIGKPCEPFLNELDCKYEPQTDCAWGKGE